MMALYRANEYAETGKKTLVIYSMIRQSPNLPASRLSLFWLSELQPPRYTGHLVWQGLLARYLLHKTHRPLAIPYSGQCWLP